MSPYLLSEAGFDVEIGIETYSRNHRGRGYGQLAARAVIDECLPELFVKKAMDMGELKKGHHFLLACGYSLANELELAYEHMRQALSFGWDGTDDVRYDFDLERLRKLSKGKALLEAYEASRR